MAYKNKPILFICLLLSLILVLSGCNKTDYVESTGVIEAEALSELEAEGSVIIIDARTQEEYDKGHLVGAINLPPSELTISEPVAGLLAPKEMVETVLGDHGISQDSKVVIYDNAEGVYASRVWWVLKIYGHKDVKVVNNGEAAILANGLELTLDVPTITPTTYTATELDQSMIADVEEVKAMAEGTIEGCIVDVRSQAEYDEGAIPTAILYPHTKNLYQDGTFRSARDISLDYTDLGLKKDEPIILYCKTSFRATQTALLLNEAGFSNVKVYDGAWMEWSTKDMPTEEKVEDTKPSTQDAS
jgi:thiosulfate/3-mercaptopyruvate sulfurtransferase